MKQNKSFLKNLRRKKHIRKKIIGTALVPRVSVFKSKKYFYAQVINDHKQETITSFSSLKLDKSFLNNVKTAKEVANQLAINLKKLNIKQVVLDRNGKPYHGKIKAFCEQLRLKDIKI